MNTLGRFGEQVAMDYLISKGHAILKKNFYTRFGEVDIFSQIGNRLHVIEVKTFKQYYLPVGYKINWKKRRRMIQCTEMFLDRFNLRMCYVQFDLIIVHNKQVNHVENCFSLTDV
tara:strand:+ start:228 stop:572 length:345 start_codon:yes stop_codon:yes gene_type:complete